MKRINRKVWLAKGLLMVSLTACSNGASMTAQQPEAVKVEPFPEESPYTPSPRVPASIKIWGKDLSLDRTDLYERLDRELTACTYTHGMTLLTLKRANRYFPEIAPILEKNGIPKDMLYLAVIESNLDNRAVSPANAAGIWQFMASTAKQYGLEVNDFVDERYNLEKATQAACKYFKEAYAKFGDWNSVAAAYNGGIARIGNETASQKENSALDLYLVTETSRYPFRIMAMKLIMENPSQYGFLLTPDQLYQPMEYDSFNVNTPVEDWVGWAKEHGISYAQLREANPWIRAKSLPNKSGKNYKVLVPKKSSLYRSTQGVKVYNPEWISE